jgi:hypothetical protein
MSFLITVFEDKESEFDLMINNRTYLKFHDLLIKEAGYSPPLCGLFHRAYVVHGMTLERDFRENSELVLEYISVWRNVIQRLLNDESLRCQLFECTKDIYDWLLGIAEKVHAWKCAVSEMKRPTLVRIPPFDRA